MTDCKWYEVSPVKFYCEQGRLDSIWVKKYCKGDWASCVRYHMEESGQQHPDWMLPDGTLDRSLR